jgi:opacity protein-like surface antigen
MRVGSAIPVALLLLASERSAWAGEEPDIPLTFSAGGSIARPISDAGGRFETGRGLLVTVGYVLTDRVAVQGEFFHSSYDIKADVLEANSVEGDHTMWYGGLDAAFQFLPKRLVGVYAVGGPGLYSRRVRITRVEGDTSVSICDPWLFTCFIGSPEETLGSISSTDFGLNVGAGVTLRYAGPLRVFLEARYHYIFGPKIDTPGGSRRATGMYLPFILGVRF